MIDIRFSQTGYSSSISPTVLCRGRVKTRIRAAIKLLALNPA
ncbi:hypothetical protein S2091_4726 [Solimicrobium silvestre]|uniref:Uncharacterized protein n=1 Tax=Solimicrobium silvestre TaxID=2099400 RepID=A0A2S9GS77_9BURK|nr:hypothetical protein S2091_4726 [Solimicrobium silvestre]